MADTTASINLKNINEWLVAVGVLMLLFCVACVLLEVQTSEAAITHGGRMMLLIPNISTLTQLYSMFTGQLTPFEFIVDIWGFGSQIAYFACIVGFKHFHKSMAKHNSWLAMICIGVAVMIALYNCITDYNYVGLVIQDYWWQLVITGVIALGASSFGIAGLHFIKAGLGWE